MIFEDGTDIYWARSRTLEYLSAVLPRLPQDVRTEMGPDATPLGWVFQYVLVDGTGKHSLEQLRSYQAFYLKYYLRSVPGVAEVAPVGGFGKQYQVNVDPNRLQAYGISINRVVEVVRSGNYESAGRLIEFGGTEYNIRGRGYIRSIQDLENIAVITSDSGTPIRSLADEPPEPVLSIEKDDVTHPCHKVTFHEGFVSDTWMAKPATSAKLCTFRVSGQTFIDVTRWPEGIDVEAMTVTWHWFGAVDVCSDELRLKLLHPFLVADYLTDHPLDLPNVTLENGDEKQLVVTARPQEIQMFLLLHLGHGDLMDEEYVLKKLPPQELADTGEDAQN